MSNVNKIKKIVILSLLTAIAIVVNIIESMIPLIPGTAFKIGFANVVILIVMFGYGPLEGLIVGVIRLLLSTLLAPASATFLLSITGGVLSIVAMLLLGVFRKFSIIPISVVGSIVHVLGQLLAARFIDITFAQAVSYYAPIMLGLSIPAGILTGIIASRILKVANRHLNIDYFKNSEQQLKKEEKQEEEKIN